MEDVKKIQEASDAGDDLEQLKQRLQLWRSERRLGEHIPAPLWTAAAAAANKHGLYRVAIELHLDYAGLKRRVERCGGATPGGQAAPRFVELFAAAAPAAATAAGRPQCVLEMQNARGAKMRVELSGQGLGGLAGLCNAFWSA